jgi:glycosyltransferase involved in cell wall biosynthesis
MKIALLVDELPTSSAPKIVGEEAYHLNKLGVKCDVFVLKHRDNEVSPAHAEEINLVHLDEGLGFISQVCGWRVPSFSFFSLYHVVYPYILSERVSRKIDDYDAVVAHSASSAIFTKRMKLRRAKLALYYHDPISYIFEEAYREVWSEVRRKLLSGLAVLIDRMSLLSSDIILLQSKFHYRRILSLVRNDRPIKVVYLGVNAVEQIPKRRGDYVLAVSRWEKGKNPFFFIRLAELLRKDFEHLTIVMAGPWRDTNLLTTFLKEVEKRGVRKNVKILGSVGENRLQNLYLNARCFIHAKIEAFGYVGLEAAAHGCPIIFPRGSGVTELFTHGVHGYFPGEGDVEEYVKYLVDLLGNERLAWKMGYEAWKVAKKYTWEAHAKELIKALS